MANANDTESKLPGKRGRRWREDEQTGKLKAEKVFERIVCPGFQGGDAGNPQKKVRVAEALRKLNLSGTEADSARRAFNRYVEEFPGKWASECSDSFKLVPPQPEHTGVKYWEKVEAAGGRVPDYAMELIVHCRLAAGKSIEAIVREFPSRDPDFIRSLAKR
jgi:hypothetical protein